MNAHESLTATYLASNLRRLRAQHKYSVKQVAEQVGVHFSTVSKYEQYGPSFQSPAFDTIDKFALLYGVKIADLFSPDGANRKQIEMGGAQWSDFLYVMNQALRPSGLALVGVPTVHEEHAVRS